MTNPIPYTLAHVREMLRDRSGRYDLASAANVDLGADALINQAQDHLDRTCGFIRRLLTRHAVRYPAGAYFLAPDRLRWVEAVYLHTSEGSKKLERRTTEWVRENYAGLLLNLDSGIIPPTGRTGQQQTSPSGATITSSTCIWSPWVIGPSPQQNQLSQFSSQGTRHGTEGLVTGDYYGNYGIIIAPPLTSAATIEILGAFYSPRLVEDEDQSFWTHHPEILTFAALWLMELASRNTEGANDYARALQQLLSGLEIDQTHEDSAQAHYMGEGSDMNG